MEKPRSLSVVIPAYNQPLMVLMALNSLQVTATGMVPIEYLVQDDLSIEPLARYISERVAKVERNPYNLGFPGNCNAGARRAKGDVLFFVNQDVYAVPEFSMGWDVALLKGFAVQGVNAVTPLLLFPDGRVQSAGGLFDAKSQPYHRCFGYSNPYAIEVNSPTPVSWGTGAALAVRADVFSSITFDEDYRGGYFEDVDLCCHIRERGGVIFYTPEVRFVHSVGSTGGNPRFLENAQRFKQLWVDTHKIAADVSAIRENFW